jgi:hypothetical protein
MPTHERLALRCMLARDFYHIAALYELFFQTPTVADATGAKSPTVSEELTKDDEPAAIEPWSEWLFDLEPAK